MKRFRFPALLLALTLCLCSLPALAESAAAAGLGEAMPDFTVATIDGGTFTLSEALKEKDMVLINLWATWCGPCRMEFPYMEEAYEQYKDRVAVIALSVEPEDTREKLVAFAADNGLTFPIANEGDLGLGDLYAYEGIPTSLVVDRFGNLVFREVGSQPSVSAFTHLFDYFLSDGYTESRVLDGPVPVIPAVMPTDEAALSAAANAEGGSLVFRNPEDSYVWPVLVEEEAQGRSSLVSSNWGEDNSTCAVLADVSAAAGDALAFEFYTSTEAACDLLTVTVDGEIVKRFGGEHDWTQWALPLSEGDHEIAFRYVKDMMVAGGEDLVKIDNVRLVSGEEAAALLAALPVYPTADAFSLTVTDENAREIVFDDPDDILEDNLAVQSFWIVPADTFHVQALVTPDIDPEAAFFYAPFEGTQTALSESLTETGYAASAAVNAMASNGYPYAVLNFYPFPEASSADAIRGVMVFPNAENVTEFVKLVAASGTWLSWSYADEAEAGGQAVPGISEYTVTFVDQNGAPVPGCIVNFCTDEACMPVVANENGVAVFSGAPYAYHLQVIKVPAGYEFDTAQEFYADEAGGALSFTVTKK